MLADMSRIGGGEVTDGGESVRLKALAATQTQDTIMRRTLVRGATRTRAVQPPVNGSQYAVT